MPDNSTDGPAKAAYRALRKHEVSRLEALSDGVFAFALTLLVVSLDVPKSFDELRGNVKGFIAFGICFGMLVHIWWEHNTFFRRFGLQDPATVVLNSILLFVVLFFVYPLKFLFTSFVQVYLGIQGGIEWAPEDLTDMFAIYGAGYVAVFMSLMLLYRHALAKRSELELDELEQFDAWTTIGFYVVHTFLGTLCVALAVLGWGMRYGLPGWIFALGMPMFGWLGWHRGCRRADLERKILPPA